MTDDERIEREREWVKARYACTVDAAFKTLVAVIESDVQSFNRLSSNDDCEVKHVDYRTVTFSRGSRVTAVSISGQTIEVRPMRSNAILKVIHITPKWNEESMSCDLVIDGKAMSMHRASQRAIGDILFPRGDT